MSKFQGQFYRAICREIDAAHETDIDKGEIPASLILALLSYLRSISMPGGSDADFIETVTKMISAAWAENAHHFHERKS